MIVHHYWDADNENASGTFHFSGTNGRARRGDALVVRPFDTRATLIDLATLIPGVIIAVFSIKGVSS